MANINLHNISKEDVKKFFIRAFAHCIAYLENYIAEGIYDY